MFSRHFFSDFFKKFSSSILALEILLDSLRSELGRVGSQNEHEVGSDISKPVRKFENSCP